jgi:hypothetical protein
MGPRTDTGYDFAPDMLRKAINVNVEIPKIDALIPHVGLINTT